MGHDDLLAASRREEVLYRDLLSAYGELAATLGATDASVDPGAVTVGYARTEAVTAALRTLAATLAPHRLTAATIPPAVRDLWAASAALAARAATVGAELAALARTRQAAVAARLTTLATGRKGVAAYRPAAGARAGVDQRA